MEPIRVNTILAALRYWAWMLKRDPKAIPESIMDVAEDSGSKLTVQQTHQLADMINEHGVRLTIDDMDVGTYLFKLLDEGFKVSFDGMSEDAQAIHIEAERNDPDNIASVKVIVPDRRKIDVVLSLLSRAFVASRGLDA